MCLKLAIFKTGNGESGNGERGTGNGEWGTGNGERGTGNGERGTGNGERGTGNGERGNLNFGQSQFNKIPQLCAVAEISKIILTNKLTDYLHNITCKFVSALLTIFFYLYASGYGILIRTLYVTKYYNINV